MIDIKRFVEVEVAPDERPMFGTLSVALDKIWFRALAPREVLNLTAEELVAAEKGTKLDIRMNSPWGGEMTYKVTFLD